MWKQVGHYFYCISIKLCHLSIHINIIEKKKVKIYTFSPKISLHQSLYKCVNIHVRYSNCVNIPDYCSFAFHFLIISHLCSLSTLSLSLSLSLSLARSQPRKIDLSLTYHGWSHFKAFPAVTRHHHRNCDFFFSRSQSLSLTDFPDRKSVV